MVLGPFCLGLASSCKNERASSNKWAHTIYHLSLWSSSSCIVRHTSYTSDQIMACVKYMRQATVYTQEQCIHGSANVYIQEQLDVRHVWCGQSPVEGA